MEHAVEPFRLRRALVGRWTLRRLVEDGWRSGWRRGRGTLRRGGKARPVAVKITGWPGAGGSDGVLHRAPSSRPRRTIDWKHSPPSHAQQRPLHLHRCFPVASCARRYSVARYRIAVGRRLTRHGTISAALVLDVAPRSPLDQTLTINILSTSREPAGLHGQITRRSACSPPSQLTQVPGPA